MTLRKLYAILASSAVFALLPGLVPHLGAGSAGGPVPAPVLADAELAIAGAKPETAGVEDPSAEQPATESGSDCATGPSQAERHRAVACLISGRGMWIWEFDTVEGGDPNAIVARALREGLSHVLIRAGSSRMGFYAQEHLDALLPVAHANGLKVLVWDFPYLEDPEADAQRVAAEFRYTTPDGHRVDGLAPDVEEPAQGVTLTRDRAERFARTLRRLVGPEAIIVMCTPRPSPPRMANYPYADMSPYVDAWAPMVYWSFDGPELDTQLAIERLSAFGGHPVAPVGRAYDMRPEGGPDQPPAAETHAFLETAKTLGAPGVSFWSWQHANGDSWKAIREFAWDPIR